MARRLGFCQGPKNLSAATGGGHEGYASTWSSRVGAL